MIISREKSPARINEIINRPDIKPGISLGEQVDRYLDASVLFHDPRNRCLTSDHGFVFFHFIEPKHFEKHTAVLPEGRGKWAIQFVKRCTDWMFLAGDTIEILARVPKNNTKSKALNVRAGYKHRWFTKVYFNGKWIDIDIFSITLQDWMNECH